MVVKCNDQMSYYSATANDIFFIVGESESQLKCRRHLVQTFLHVLSLCVDSACIVYQDKSSDAHLEMNVRLFTSYNKSNHHGKHKNTTPEFLLHSQAANSHSDC